MSRKSADRNLDCSMSIDHCARVQQIFWGSSHSWSAERRRLTPSGETRGGSRARRASLDNTPMQRQGEREGGEGDDTPVLFSHHSACPRHTWATSSAVALGIVLLTIRLMYAAELPCSPKPKPFSLKYGEVTLLINYQPVAILIEDNLRLEVSIAYSPTPRIARGQFFRITQIQFYKSDLIALISDLEPNQEVRDGKWMTENGYTFLISEDTKPGNYEGWISFQIPDQPPLKERFCVPIGSREPNYLTVRAPALTLVWGISPTSRQFVLELQNEYPYSYAITDVKPRNDTNLYQLTLLEPELPIVVRRYNTRLKFELKTLSAWSTFPESRGTPMKAQIDLLYHDPYGREVEGKVAEVEFTIIPPSWLLWLLAFLGGLVGGSVRFLAARHDDPAPVLWDELRIGAVMGLAAYAIFRLGGISLIISASDLMVDNSMVVVALLLGLLGGWQGKTLLERVV
jgi:hypothetical protein